ncbi:MAG: hypothetical protein J7L47_10135 [Candidatus Odinarchaeota archaeon]|nr:hypothetical protein [Candidatus Odinarchaeota archaeon]
MIQFTLYGFTFEIYKDSISIYDKLHRLLDVLPYINLDIDDIVTLVRVWLISNGVLDPNTVMIQEVVSNAFAAGTISEKPKEPGIERISQTTAQLYYQKIIKESEAKEWKLSIIYFVEKEQLGLNIYAFIKEKKESCLDISNYISSTSGSEIILKDKSGKSYDILEIYGTKIDAQDIISLSKGTDVFVTVVDAETSHEKFKLLMESTHVAEKEIIIISLGWHPSLEKFKTVMRKSNLIYGLFVCSDIECAKEKILKIVSRNVCPSERERIVLHL